MSLHSEVRDRCETHASVCNGGTIPRTSEVRDPVSTPWKMALPPRPRTGGWGLSGGISRSRTFFIQRCEVRDFAGAARESIRGAKLGPGWQGDAAQAHESHAGARRPERPKGRMGPWRA